MNKLSIISYSIDLTVAEKSSLIAFDKPKISALTKVDMVDQLSDAVARGYVNLNQSADKNDPKNALLVQRQMVSSLISDLKDSFGTFSVEEVCIAVDMGSKGKLNNLTEIIQPVMSLTNILAWVWLYRDKIRREAIHKQKQHEEKEAKENDLKNQEEARLKFEATILKIYEEFPNGFKTKNKGSLAWIYRHLDAKGLIKLSEPAKWEIYNQVLKIRDRAKNLRYPKDSGLRLPDYAAITELDLSAYRALYKVFEDWKEFEYDLKEELRIANETEGDKRK